MGFFPVVGRAIVVFIAVFLIWAIVHMGVADSLASRAPELALQWWPTQPEARARALQQTGAASNLDRSALATQTLEDTPLRGTAYATLAAESAAKGELDGALEAYLIAARHSPRERLTQAWLADDAVRRGKFDQAVFRFDQLLRLSPRQAHTLLPALVSLAGLPGGRSAVAEWLASRPSLWREKFLVAWASKAPDEAALDAIFDPLRDADIRLTSDERDLWITRLMSAQRTAKAYFLWVDGLPEDQRSQIGNVFDGGFELPPSDGGFGWRIGRVPGALIRQQSTVGVSGLQALAVEFQNRRVAFDHVRQLLALPPGDYVLSGRVRLDDLRNERGLRWRVSCQDGKKILAETEAMNGRRGWSNFNAPLTVPDKGCAGQWLQLRLDARIAAEQRVGGRAWFDDLRISRAN